MNIFEYESDAMGFNFNMNTAIFNILLDYEISISLSEYGKQLCKQYFQDFSERHHMSIDVGRTFVKSAFKIFQYSGSRTRNVYFIPSLNQKSKTLHLIKVNLCPRLLVNIQAFLKHSRITQILITPIKYSYLSMKMAKHQYQSSFAHIGAVIKIVADVFVITKDATHWNHSFKLDSSEYGRNILFQDDSGQILDLFEGHRGTNGIIHPNTETSVLLVDCKRALNNHYDYIGDYTEKSFCNVLYHRNPKIKFQIIATFFPNLRSIWWHNMDLSNVSIGAMALLKEYFEKTSMYEIRVVYIKQVSKYIIDKYSRMLEDIDVTFQHNQNLNQIGWLKNSQSTIQSKQKLKVYDLS